MVGKEKPGEHWRRWLVMSCESHLHGKPGSQRMLSRHCRRRCWRRRAHPCLGNRIVGAEDTPTIKRLIRIESQQKMFYCAGLMLRAQQNCRQCRTSSFLALATTVAAPFRVERRIGQTGRGDNHCLRQHPNPFACCPFSTLAVHFSCCTCFPVLEKTEIL